jgi:hypothetical protein
MSEGRKYQREKAIMPEALIPILIGIWCETNTIRME